MVLEGHLTSWLPLCRNLIKKCKCPSLPMCASEANGIGYMDAKYAYLSCVIAIRVSFLGVFIRYKRTSYAEVM
jgi:hypothetical protein